MTPHTRWSAAEIAELRRLDRLGMSAAAIATILERERNAVCGKLFRLRRRDPAPPKPKPAVAKAAPPPRSPGRQFLTPRAPVMPAAEAGEKPVVAPGAPPGGVALLDAGRLHCRMIIGDIHAADTRVCGCPVQPGASWCPTHYGVVFTRRSWGYGEAAS